ncbi:MAG: RrF2 family transcriptional regulator [Phycisphaerae bacterium]
MRMTTRGRYSLRAMLELARCYGGPPVLMNTLAERERISRKYLHVLLASLRSAGLVQSARGAGGGFRLSRSPSRIRLSEILHAAEGPLSVVECVTRPAVCGRAKTCTARRVWEKLSIVIERAIGGVTLQELVETEATHSTGRLEGVRPKNQRRAKPSGRSAGRARTRQSNE